ncbi:MAG: hypothetical protein K0R82_1241 [Flavipsychrobacter sp.]|jgi:hypothetical protein|nr:hypothetical protein [Flavipsychrobacter sp.]
MNRIQLLFFCILSTFSYQFASAQCATNTTPTNNCTYGDVINSFTLNSIASTGSGTNPCTNGYVSFSSPVWTLTIGQSYSFSSAVGSSSYPQGLAIWIDLNSNSQYDNSEMLFSSSAAALSHSGSIAIPASATAGNNVRMRVRCGYYATFTAGQACTNSVGSYGETEDFYVNLTSPCAAPNISGQPQSVMTCEAQDVQFSVTATNGTTYQWQVNPGSGWSNVVGANYSGATTSTLNVNDVTIGFNSRQYRCIVTGACNNPVTSNAATLTVNPGPAITSQTMADTICHNAITTLSVNTAGTVTNYKWQMAVATVGVFTDVPNQPPFSGVNTKNLTIVPVPDSLNDYIFRCAVIGGQCPSLNSTPIPMTVLESPVFIEDPEDAHIPPYTDAQFEAASTPGKPVVFYWQASADGINFSNIYDNALYAKTKTPMLTVKAVPLSMSNWWFRCIIKSADPQCGLYYDTSNAAQLKMVVPQDVNDLAANNQIVVYPNPVTGTELFISTQDKIDGVFRATVIDKLGRVVATTEINLSNNKAATIAVGHLAPGIYSLHIADADGKLNATSTFTKQ